MRFALSETETPGLASSPETIIGYPEPKQNTPPTQIRSSILIFHRSDRRIYRRQKERGCVAIREQHVRRLSRGAGVPAARAGGRA
jgi:hypothetical protein